MPSEKTKNLMFRIPGVQMIRLMIDKAFAEHKERMKKIDED